MAYEAYFAVSYIGRSGAVEVYGLSPAASARKAGTGIGEAAFLAFAAEVAKAASSLPANIAEDGEASVSPEGAMGAAIGGDGDDTGESLDPSQRATQLTFLFLPIVMRLARPRWPIPTKAVFNLSLGELPAANMVPLAIHAPIPAKTESFSISRRLILFRFIMLPPLIHSDGDL